MSTCPSCLLGSHDGETCHQALGRALAESRREINDLRGRLAALAGPPANATPAPRWRGTLRG